MGILIIMIMLLIFHISVALGGMLLAGVSMFAPTATKIYTAYGLIAGTLASGTALVLISGSNLVQSCITGLAYLLVVGGATALGRYKLALQPNK